MANYQLGPVIGKIGGAEVQKIPVNIVADGGVGSEVIMHTVNVPPGETWLVALSGDLVAHFSGYAGAPRLYIGNVSTGGTISSGQNGLATEITGTAEIGIRRSNSSGTDRFDGHVYTVPLP